MKAGDTRLLGKGSTPAFTRSRILMHGLLIGAQGRMPSNHEILHQSLTWGAVGEAVRVGLVIRLICTQLCLAVVDETVGAESRRRDLLERDASVLILEDRVAD